MSKFLDASTSPQQIRALASVNQNPVLLTALQNRKQEAMESLAKAEGTERMCRLQGSVNILTELLDAIQKSPEVLARTEGS